MESLETNDLLAALTDVSNALKKAVADVMEHIAKSTFGKQFIAGLDEMINAAQEAGNALRAEKARKTKEFGRRLRVQKKERDQRLKADEKARKKQKETQQKVAAKGRKQKGQQKSEQPAKKPKHKKTRGQTSRKHTPTKPAKKNSKKSNSQPDDLFYADFLKKCKNTYTKAKTGTGFLKTARA